MKNNKRLIQYKMTQQMASMLLKSRHGNERKIENQKYLCDYVNKTCGLNGTCVEVLTTL